MEKCRRPLPFLSFSSPGVEAGAEAALPGAAPGAPAVFRRLAALPGAAGGVAAAAPDPRFTADAGGDAGSADADASTCGDRGERGTSVKERGTCAFRVSVRERGLVRKREARGSRFTKKLLVFFGSLEADFPFSRLDHHWIWMLERQNICRAERARLGDRAPSPCARGSAGPPRPRRSPRSCPPGRPRRPCCAGKARWSPPSRPAPVSPRRSLIRCHLSRPHPCRTALRTETNHEGDEEAVSGASGNASGRGPSVRSRRALDGDLTTRASPAVAAGTANPQSPLR